MDRMKSTRSGRPSEVGQRHHASTPEGVLPIDDALTTVARKTNDRWQCVRRMVVVALAQKMSVGFDVRGVPAKHRREFIAVVAGGTGGTLNLKRSR
jgi:hypothetical protein